MKNYYDDQEFLEFARNCCMVCNSCDYGHFPMPRLCFDGTYHFDSSKEGMNFRAKKTCEAYQELIEMSHPEASKYEHLCLYSVHYTITDEKLLDRGTDTGRGVVSPGEFVRNAPFTDLHSNTRIIVNELYSKADESVLSQIFSELWNHALLRDGTWYVTEYELMRCIEVKNMLVSWKYIGKGIRGDQGYLEYLRRGGYFNLSPEERSDYIIFPNYFKMEDDVDDL